VLWNNNIGKASRKKREFAGEGGDIATFVGCEIIP
jgi:hypothetical protein